MNSRVSDKGTPPGNTGPTFFDMYGPRVLLGSILLFSVWMVIDAKLFGTPDTARMIASRDVTFERQADKTLAVLQYPERTLVATLPNADEGFVAMTIRGLARERRVRYNVPENGPYRLSRDELGRMALIDPSTGNKVDLSPFGKTNYGAFSALLGDGRQVK